MSFFSCSKAERGEVGTPVTVSLCTKLANTDRVVGRKCWTLQVAKGQPSEDVCEVVEAPVSFRSDGWKHFWFHCVRK